MEEKEQTPQNPEPLPPQPDFPPSSSSSSSSTFYQSSSTFLKTLPSSSILHLFSTISIAAPSSLAVDKKLSISAEKLSQLASLASVSSSSFSGRRRNFCLEKRCSSHIRAMAKEFYFNKDESAIKKLQTGVNKIADLVGVTLGPKVEMSFSKASMDLLRLLMMELQWLQRSTHITSMGFGPSRNPHDVFDFPLGQHDYGIWNHNC